MMLENMDQEVQDILELDTVKQTLFDDLIAAHK